MLIGVLLLVLIANGLIFFHELGHLLAAKWAGMPVTSFSVGFGPSLLSFQHGETRYQLALIPLGGFVRIMGMTGTDEDRVRWPNGFAFQPLHRRMIVIVAGVAMNAIVALMIYSGLAATGGGGNRTPARISEVFEDDLPVGSAEWAGLPDHSAIVSFGSRQIGAWEDFVLALLAVEPGPQELVFADGTRMDLDVPDGDQARIELLQAMLPAIPPVLGRIQDGSPAEEAGLRKGDRIVATNGVATPTYKDWLDNAFGGEGNGMLLRVLRGAEGIDVVVYPPAHDFEADGSFGWLGAHLGSEGSPTDLSDAMAYGVAEVERNARFITEGGKLVLTGAVGLRQVSGPVEIARMSERAYQMNWHQWFALVAFLSLNLAVLNFLPIPVLDGGHFFLLCAEGIVRRPLPKAVHRYGNLAGATVVGFFMLFAFLNDILRLLGI